MKLQSKDKVLRNGGIVCHNCRIDMDQQFKAFEEAEVSRLNIGNSLWHSFWIVDDSVISLS